MGGQAQTLNRLPDRESDKNEGSQSEKPPFLTSPRSPGVAGRELPPPALANSSLLGYPETQHLPWSLLHFLGVKSVENQLLEERLEVTLSEK